MITKEDVLDWQRSPITQRVTDSLREQIQGLEEELGASAGIDPRQDAIKVGAIQAKKDFLSFDDWELVDD